MKRFILLAAMILAVPAHAVSTPTNYFAAVNEKMHEGMMLQPSGNVDVDFARGMIAHHQGAIDMARVHLKYSKNPELRALSEAIIKAQEPEIKQMQAWLNSHSQKK